MIIDNTDYFVSAHSHLVKDFGSIGKTRFIVSGSGGSVEKGFEAGLLVVNVSPSENVIKHSIVKLPVNSD